MAGYSTYILCAALFYTLAVGAPQVPAPVPALAPAPQPPAEKPMPYQYDYKVEDANNSLYFGAQEMGNEAGRVEGSYYVWLPDGRLMKVSYFVEGGSGFRPTITFQDNATPIGQPPPT